MATTEKTSTEDITKVCEKECSVTWHNTTTKKKGRCSKTNYDKCYTNDKLDEPVYEYINWKKLKTEFHTFLTKWLDTSETKQLLTELFGLLVANNKTIPKNPTYKINDLVTNGQCNDSNFTIVAQIPDDAALQLFHIAFHSKEPKYRKHTDTIFSCGYYENPESKPGSGAFHYKINSGTQQIATGTDYKKLLKDIEFEEPKHQPYKRITFYDKELHDAKLWYRKSGDDFQNKEHMITDPTKQQNIIDKHKAIYKHFIKSWNNDRSFRNNIKCAKPVKKGGKQIRIQQRYITRKIDKKIGKKIGKKIYKKKYTKRK